MTWWTAALAALLLVAPVSATQRPDFSGNWVLESGERPAFGTTLTATQDDRSLTLELTSLHLFDSRPAQERADEHPVLRYAFDGRSVVTEHVVPQRSGRSPTSTGQALEGSETRATWSADHLVVVTHSRHRVWSPESPDNWTLRRTTRHGLSLRADGALVVRTVTIEDPSPWRPAPQASPREIVSVYRRSN